MELLFIVIISFIVYTVLSMAIACVAAIITAILFHIVNFCKKKGGYAHD
jgi:hypothetical protein